MLPDLKISVLKTKKSSPPYLCRSFNAHFIFYFCICRKKPQKINKKRWSATSTPKMLPDSTHFDIKPHLADSIPEWGWFYIVKTMLFEKSLNLCLYLQWDMNMPFISACIYNGSWACVSFLLVFTMVLERVCQLLLVFTMSLKHEIKEINILFVFTMAW